MGSTAPRLHRDVSRFRPNPAKDDPVYVSVPDDGLCLNAFVLLSPSGDRSRVLLGMLDPTASWREIGGVTPQRLAELGTRWMLPSRQLFLFESPADAAQSIVREQLEVPALELTGPMVFSESWTRPKPAGVGPHWGPHFLFRGVWPLDRELRASPWLRLRIPRPFPTGPIDDRSKPGRCA